MAQVNPPEKRTHPAGGSANSRRNKKKRYRQYSNTVSRKDLGKGNRGFLISCTPKHENQTFRDALVLLDSHVDLEALAAAPPSPPEEEALNAQSLKPQVNDQVVVSKADETSTGASLTASLDAELTQLKAPKKDVIFEHLDCNMRGSVFVRVRDARVNLESVVESILTAARRSGEPGCRFVQKIQPIHTTCYASPEEAAAASVAVVADHFPKDAPSAKYAIQFKARANTGAHRADYIKVIADAILGKFGDRFTVDLTEPDVVLLVEVIKTSCCVGAFGPYFQLGKLNVRVAAEPPKEKVSKSKVSDAGMKKPDAGNDDGKKTENGKTSAGEETKEGTNGKTQTDEASGREEGESEQKCDANVEDDEVKKDINPVGATESKAEKKGADAE